MKMFYLTDHEGLIYNRSFHATDYDLTVYNHSKEFNDDLIPGQRLIDDNDLPIYKLVGDDIVKTTDDDFTDLSHLKDQLLSKAKQFTNEALAKTDYIEIRQIDPEENEKMTEEELIAIREYRRGFRDIYRSFKTQLANADKRGLCNMLYREFKLEVQNHE